MIPVSSPALPRDSLHRDDFDVYVALNVAEKVQPDGVLAELTDGFGYPHLALPELNSELLRGGNNIGGILTHFYDGSLYNLANVFMLAWPYGYPKVMSSYDWQRDGTIVVEAVSSTNLFPIATPFEDPPLAVADALGPLAATLELEDAFLPNDGLAAPRLEQYVRPYALTNPIWIDADGNGRFDPPGNDAGPGLSPLADPSSCTGSGSRIGACCPRSQSSKSNSQVPIPAAPCM